MQADPIRVLLVEDDPADAEFARRSLRKTGPAQFEVCWASRLSEALERLHSIRSDVVLLDLGLPECSGLEALDELRHENHEIPIVVLTGLNDDLKALAALERGAQDYLAKGNFTAEALGRSIRYAIQRQQLLAAVRDNQLAAENCAIPAHREGESRWPSL